MGREGVEACSVSCAVTVLTSHWEYLFIASKRRLLLSLLSWCLCFVTPYDISCVPLVNFCVYLTCSGGFKMLGSEST